MPRASSTSSPSSFLDEGRFPAGTVLADRYRILGLLGRGGMGEVYRASDLKLGQLVALKFLPESLSGNERMLDRFHAEVRIARQVSHPNVCRVYDIGEVDGAAYITMEYVDGEDLASLLRRIGRLPPDKAVEMARKLCAGLAAAHDKGVLHRDLKPANVMVDGRGQVLITDFGLAGFAGQVEGAEIRNGTPAYMAPEQLSGREVSVRSDLYSLGLILYEMLSGKRAFQGSRAGGATPQLTGLGSEVDPAIERVIQRCLAEEPSARPRSALAVAAALPGGDPLAAALAAGETPSPEMVAAAGEAEGFRVRTLIVVAALIAAALPPLVWLLGKVNLLQQLPLDKPPAVLAHLAAETIRGFGYTDRPLDSAFGLVSDGDISAYAERHWNPDAIRRQINRDQPAYAFFWYLQSPRHLLPWQPGQDRQRGGPAVHLFRNDSLRCGHARPAPGVRRDSATGRRPEFQRDAVAARCDTLVSCGGVGSRALHAGQPAVGPAFHLRCARRLDRCVAGRAGCGAAYRSCVVAGQAGLFPDYRAVVGAASHGRAGAHGW